MYLYHGKLIMSYHCSVLNRIYYSYQALEQKVQLFRFAAKALSEEADRQIKPLLQYRNTLAPIHRLPLEIMTDVCQRTLEEQGHSAYWNHGHAYLLQRSKLIQVSTS